MGGFSETHLQEVVLRLSTNPAKLLNVYPQKGILKEGSDADLFVLKESAETRQFQSTLSESYDAYEEFHHTLDFQYVFKGGHLSVQNNKYNERSEFRGNNICRK